ncbi:MAG: DEAD/DEAH box helicase [Mariprofundaceae bacterium]|nr:DEAD/DEAH box helicase [Mariprofundaceae bacterium]
MKLTEEALKLIFFDSYFKRGKTYFNRGYVRELEVLSDGAGIVVLSSVVHGSSGDYTQDINIQLGEKDVNVVGYCSCPMDYNCKHVVAACLQYIENITKNIDPKGIESSEDASLAWLNSFSDSFQEHRNSIPMEGLFLVYILHHINGRIKVRLHQTQCLKRGGLSKGKSLEFCEICASIDYSARNYIQPLDVEIINLLATSTGRYSSEAKVVGKTGFLAIQQMLASGRCFWNDYNTLALTEGKARDFLCEWVIDKHNNASLKTKIRPDAILIPTEPALYFDIIKNEIGRFNDMPYSLEQLTMLQEAPVIPATLVDEFSQRAALTIPTRIFSPPKSIEIERIEGCKAKSHLWLRLFELEGKLYRVARLRFDYGAYELSVFPREEEIRLSKKNHVIIIQRDLDIEENFCDTLKEYGMISGKLEETNDMYFLFEEEKELQNDALWLEFIENMMPKLLEDGWLVDVADNFQMELHEVDAWYAEIEESGNDWFDLSFDIEINGKKQALLPLVTQVLEHYDLENLPETLVVKLGNGQYLKMLSEQIKPVLNILYELYDDERLSDDGSLKISHFDAARLSDLDQNNSSFQWQGGKELRELGQRLKDFSGIDVIQPPQGLKAELRDYQQQGLNWLQFLCNYHLNGILADDMGLGKTVQTLAHLLVEKEQGRLNHPCLIVAPTSLMGNWKREALAFAPDLKVLILQGADRHQNFEFIEDHDIVLSTYPLLVRDEAVLLKHAFHIVVLDEAQVVKNPKSKAARVIRQFKTKHRLCLTGTPMENHLGELWSLFDFLMPGFLGDSKQFNSLFRTPIEKHGDSGLQKRLVQRIKPFMLRRTKSEVAAELPEKTIMTRMVTLNQKQAALYESIRLAMEDKVKKTIANKGLARSHIIILDALLKLRQVCCDPRILSLKQAKKVDESAKLDALMDMVPEMLEEGRRILIFSQFTKMLALIEGEIKSRNISYSKLTGQTRKRDEAIDKFKQGHADVFLISLKAGGVGLNLTEADTVIHYDPWWNPAAENQATDRVHRIGQDKAVFVYKLVVENSVEEKIIAMQEKKKALADAVYETGTKKNETMLTAHDMEALFAPLV